MLMLMVTTVAMIGLMQPLHKHDADFPGADHADRYGNEDADGDNSRIDGVDAGINMMPSLVLIMLIVMVMRMLMVTEACSEG